MVERVELIAELEYEIRVFERPSRRSSDAALAMLKTDASRIAELEAQAAADKDELARLREVLKEARCWDGYDSEGVPAIWVKDANEILGEQP